MAVTERQAWAAFAEAELLYSAGAVEAALTRMAQEIGARIGDRNPLVLCVMVGALVASGRLLTQLNFPLQIDYLHATRYRGETRGGELHWMVRPATPLEGRVVLVIDDILDEGATLAAILDYCHAEGAREVYSAVLIDKHHARRVRGLQADFTGLHVADRYVFGYGMDYQGYLRNAAGIYAVKGL